MPYPWIIPAAQYGYPGVQLFFTISGFVMLMGNGRFSATFTQYLANMTMPSEFMKVPSIDGAYWSIFIEIRFYLLIAILLVARHHGVAPHRFLS
ncbi:hypothetical protein D9M71_131940 [compost metagenome]